MDSLGSRMKEYENVNRIFLTRRLPVIIRIDGKAFHTFTKGLERPIDVVLQKTMFDTAKYLCENIMGCKLAYVQSDEISLLLTDYDKIESQPWFGKNILKMVSISASMATLAFNQNWIDNSNLFYKGSSNTEYFNILKSKNFQAMFDSRAFVLPKEEVNNYFIWRQSDATKNAIQNLGRCHFSHRELHGKTCNEIQEMIFQYKGINFNNLPTGQRRGVCIIKQNRGWEIQKDIPIFKQNINYIEKLIDFPI